MGETRPVRPVLRLLVIFSRYREALQWARERAEDQWGRIELASAEFPFDQTEYYRSSMGDGLVKQILAFAALMDAGELAATKQLTNSWEQEYADIQATAEARPLNLDPGYLTEAKLILASTKDRDHRIYLERGIFAEVTLFFRHGKWRTRDWTYPDYATAGYHEFLDRCRVFLRSQYRREFAS